MHTILKDVTVELTADRPGTLGRAFDTVSKAGINIDGFAEIGGTLHVLTGDAAGSKAALESGGFRVVAENDVVVVDAPNRPGIAADLFRSLGDANVNVSFAYAASNNRLAVGAPNVAKAAEILARAGAAV